MLDLGVVRERSLTGNQAQALILQGALASVGEGMALAKLRRYVRSQSGKPFSDHVCDKTLHEMVKDGLLNVDTKTTKGGVTKRSYHITLEGVFMLRALVMHLPKQSRQLTSDFMSPMLAGAATVLNTAIHQNGNAK